MDNGPLPFEIPELERRLVKSNQRRRRSRRVELPHRTLSPGEFRDGAEFLQRFQTHDDPVTTIKPDATYRVVGPVRHPVEENERVLKFMDARRAAKTGDERRSSRRVKPAQAPPPFIHAPTGNYQRWCEQSCLNPPPRPHRHRPMSALEAAEEVLAKLTRAEQAQLLCWTANDLSGA